LLYVAAKLGLADLLADGPHSSAELAQSLGAHAPSLHRILRGLVVLGVCAEEEDGRFGLTALGTCLHTEMPESFRGSVILCGEESVGAWCGLHHSAMTGETAFNHVFGMSQWEHRVQHPELNEYFNAGLSEGAMQAAGALLAAYDLSPFRTIADVGGGHGALLAAILKAHPSVTGILYDQPHVVAGGQAYLEAAGVAARCQVVGGDFFERVPEGADAHILKSVIHDWDDERSLAILRNCHRALRPQGRLLLVERIMPLRAEQDPAVIWGDLNMLAMTGGRERTQGEYSTLLAAAGFSLGRVVPTRSGLSVIEGIRAEGRAPARRDGNLEK
jgi:SAM-dependent methyltransferase